MADVKILEINGTEFNIKDEKARQDIEKANTQLSTIANQLAVTLAIGEDGLLYLADSKGNLLGSGIKLDGSVPDVDIADNDINLSDNILLVNRLVNSLILENGILTIN